MKKKGRFVIDKHHTALSIANGYVNIETQESTDGSITMVLCSLGAKTDLERKKKNFIQKYAQLTSKTLKLERKMMCTIQINSLN